MFTRIRHILISFFILLTVFSIFRNNLTEKGRAVFSSYSDRVLPTSYQRILSDSLIRLSWYPYLTGLDGLWVMFVGAHQQDWRFHITARYLGGTRRVLPLSRQSERSLFQRHIVDFRDEKFYLHLYSNELEQKRYASFLCEKFSEFEGREIVSVSFERLHQKFLPIHEAFRVGHHLEEQTRTWVLNDFQCSQKGLSRLG